MAWCFFAADNDNTLLGLACNKQLKLLSQTLQQMAKDKIHIRRPGDQSGRTLCHALAAIPPEETTPDEMRYLCNLIYHVYCNGQPNPFARQEPDSFSPMTHSDFTKNIEPPITIAVRTGNVGMVAGLLPAYYATALPAELVLLALAHKHANVFECLLNFSREKPYASQLDLNEQFCNFHNGIDSLKYAEALQLAINTKNDATLNKTLDLLDYGFTSSNITPDSFTDFPSNLIQDLTIYSESTRAKLAMLQQKIMQATQHSNSTATCRPLSAPQPCRTP